MNGGKRRTDDVTTLTTRLLDPISVPSPITYHLRARTYARVEGRRDDVGDEVRGDDDGSAHDRCAQDERVVVLLQCSDAQPAKTRDGEDGLDEERPGE